MSKEERRRTRSNYLNQDFSITDIQNTLKQLKQIRVLKRANNKPTADFSEAEEPEEENQKE